MLFQEIVKAADSFVVTSRIVNVDTFIMVAMAGSVELLVFDIIHFKWIKIFEEKLINFVLFFFMFP